MTKPRVFIGIAGMMALTGCLDATNFDPAAPDENRTQQGALTGALVGAIAGIAQADDGDKGRDAIIGAALGAGAGALIGQQLDRQEAELRAELGNNVSITRQGNELIVRMPQDILFDTDSATLRPDLQGDLRSLAANLLRYPNTTVTVIGHTDWVGDAGYNQNLSKRRADSVAGILRVNGVSANRIIAFGRGEAEPIADNVTPEGRRQNRRVEIIIRPNA
ncbi:MAG: OmpA family protein [Pseudomonadota bacterium]